MPQRIGRASVQFHPGAFSQAHLGLFDRILEIIEAWTPQGARLLEIYAGTGGISLHLAPHLKSAVLIEDNPYAALSFSASSPSDSFRYIQGDAKIAQEHIPEADLIVVDPPRKGLDPALLESLCKTDRKTLIYISCDFNSFERDAKRLLEANWRIEDAKAFWLFPGTDHIELAVRFCI